MVLGICHREWFLEFCPTVNEIVNLALYITLWLYASISAIAFFVLLLKSISFGDCQEEHLKALTSCHVFQLPFPPLCLLMFGDGLTNKEMRCVYAVLVKRWMNIMASHTKVVSDILSPVFIKVYNFAGHIFW